MLNLSQLSSSFLYLLDVLHLLEVSRANPFLSLQFLEPLCNKSISILILITWKPSFSFWFWLLFISILSKFKWVCISLDFFDSSCMSVYLHLVWSRIEAIEEIISIVKRYVKLFSSKSYILLFLDVRESINLFAFLSFSNIELWWFLLFFIWKWILMWRKTEFAKIKSFWGIWLGFSALFFLVMMSFLMMNLRSRNWLIQTYLF